MFFPPICAEIRFEERNLCLTNTMRAIKTLCLTTLCFLSAYFVRANHIYGADFYYEHVSGNSYRIIMDIYGDCGTSTPASFQNLYTTSPEIEIFNGSQRVSTIRLTLTGTPNEVTPVCSALLDSTRCKSTTSTIPGVTRFHYTAVYNLNGTSKNWHFKFEGTLPQGMKNAGRSSNLTNVNGISIIALDAFLDNSAGPNSSATFTTIPTPFYCVNTPQNYNPGAVDANKDSLYLSLVSAQVPAGNPPVIYISPATPTAPLATASGSFSFNNNTGQMSFTPSAVQRSLVVQQVDEYRNGVLVGTAMREMTVIVLANCNNNPLTIAIDSSSASIRNAAWVTGNAINICQGTDSVEFRIATSNPAKDTIEASITGLPAGVVANILKNHSPDPSIEIDWHLPGLAPGTYNFFVTYHTNSCPLNSVQTQAYTVTVIRPNTFSFKVLNPTNCIQKARVMFNISNGLVPRQVEIRQNGNLVSQVSDLSGLIIDSLAAGTYHISISSLHLSCPTLATFRIVDSGLYPNKPQIDSIFYCLNDPASAINAKADSGAILNWYAIDGAPMMGAPTPRTDSAGIFMWLVGQQMKTCKSLTDTLKVYVTRRPTSDFTLPASICAHDSATIQFSGAIGVGPILEYHWNWGDAETVVGTDQGPWKVRWYTPGKKTIKLTVSENRCSSAETQHELTVQPIPYAGFDISTSTCQFDTLFVRYNSKPHAGQIYAWSFQDADTAMETGQGPFTVRWHSAGKKRVSLMVDLNGCKDTRSAEVMIYPAPDAQILNAAGPVCVGDKIYLRASGGATYTWTPEDSLQYSASGELYAQILKPTQYKVQVRSEYGCADSAAIRYDVVEACCQFSYPNAFTPNGDGRNDRFRIVTHGNHIRYELSIFNNWGQRVYYGLDPEEGWDGTFRGKPCETGSYFYYLNATCYTGRQETQKGDLMLVR